MTPWSEELYEQYLLTYQKLGTLLCPLNNMVDLLLLNIVWAELDINKNIIVYQLWVNTKANWPLKALLRLPF